MEEFSDLEETGINIANLNEIDFSSQNIITPLEENNPKSVEYENVVNINFNFRKFLDEFEYHPELEPYLNKPLFYDDNNPTKDNHLNNDVSKLKKLKNFLEICKKYKLSFKKTTQNEINNEIINENYLKTPTPISSQNQKNTYDNFNKNNFKAENNNNKTDTNNINNNIFAGKNFILFYFI